MEVHHMCDKNVLHLEIELLKKDLQTIMIVKDWDLLDNDVIEVSQKLDEAIIKYQKLLL